LQRKTPSRKPGPTINETPVSPATKPDLDAATGIIATTPEVPTLEEGPTLSPMPTMDPSLTSTSIPEDQPEPGILTTLFTLTETPSPATVADDASPTIQEGEEKDRQQRIKGKTMLPMNSSSDLSLRQYPIASPGKR